LGGTPYRVATVDKVTPTGRIVVKINDWIRTFRPDGRQLGKKYFGECIDWTPFAERAALVAADNRVRKAAIILNQLQELRRLGSNLEASALKNESCCCKRQ